MFGLGMGEMVLIVIIAIVLFGTQDLPKNLRKAAKGFTEFKKVANDAQRSWMEVRDDMARTIMSVDLEEQKINKQARIDALHGNSGSEGIPSGETLAADPNDPYLAEQQALADHEKRLQEGATVPSPAPNPPPVILAAVGSVARTSESGDISGDLNHNHHQERASQSEAPAATSASSQKPS
jgi:TatA/E family protein of Tat protein translocase